MLCETCMKHAKQCFNLQPIWNSTHHLSVEAFFKKVSREHLVFITKGYIIVESIYRRTWIKADSSIRRTSVLGSGMIVMQEKSNKESLYNTDISIRQTKFFAPMVSAIERFHINLLSNNKFLEITKNITNELSKKKQQ